MQPVARMSATTAVKGEREGAGDEDEQGGFKHPALPKIITYVPCILQLKIRGYREAGEQKIQNKFRDLHLVAALKGMGGQIQ